MVLIGSMCVYMLLCVYVSVHVCMRVCRINSLSVTMAIRINLNRSNNSIHLFVFVYLGGYRARANHFSLIDRMGLTGYNKGSLYLIWRLYLSHRAWLIRWNVLSDNSSYSYSITNNEEYFSYFFLFALLYFYFLFFFVFCIFHIWFYLRESNTIV